MAEDSRYVPALRYRALTALYDPVVRLTSREGAFKRRLLEIAELKAEDRVLDLGCGTGTLAIAASQAQPGAEVTGLDGDPEVLARARRKASSAGAHVDFDEGLSTELPYDDGRFDVVLSTLFFHHLEPAAKRVTAAEIARVLRPGGRLLVADWGPPQDALMRIAFLAVRSLDGFELTRENAEGALPSIFADAGLQRAEQVDRLRTATGTMAFFVATAPRPQ
ncbi:MAG: class I SAM-dependent methyltransferase [Actinobacteria bacterium]|nr:class I SAM-dependent methyltransferase [Actinomycetota bacterium]